MYPPLRLDCRKRARHSPTVRTIRALVFAATAATASLTSPDLRAEPTPSPAPWSHLGRNLEQVYLGPNALFQLGAVGATTGLVFSGADHAYHAGAARSGFLSDAGGPAVVVGSFLPGAAILAAYGLALIDGTERSRSRGHALL